MEQTVILPGFSKILIYTSSTCLTLIRLLCYWAVSRVLDIDFALLSLRQVSPSTALQLSSVIFAISKPTSGISLPTGGYGKRICPDIRGRPTIGSFKQAVTTRNVVLCSIRHTFLAIRF